ncbi:tyrosine-type recombinase/integrase [uncultured Nostoc sp.]|uniref:tyrosine-type recombinase/integrase n=1 Tax=uncultured Nostoc sp. TaxID=340711 RepID=UPI0035CAF482
MQEKIMPFYRPNILFLSGASGVGKTTITILRIAVEKAGLSAKGISTHSTRRTFITNLANKGINLVTIKKITGDSDLKVLSAYSNPCRSREKYR